MLNIISALRPHPSEQAFPTHNAALHRSLADLAPAAHHESVASNERRLAKEMTWTNVAGLSPVAAIFMRRE